MRIKILKPELVILGEVREVGAIVKDENAAECRNLIADGRAAALTPEEESAEDAKELEAAQQAEQDAEKAKEAQKTTE